MEYGERDNLKTALIFDTTTHSIDSLKINLEKIMFDQLPYSDKTFSLIYKTDHIDMNIKIRGKLATIIRETLKYKKQKQEFKGNYFKLKQNGERAFNLTFNFSYDKVKAHNFEEGPLILFNTDFSKPNILYRIEIKLSKQRLDEMTENALSMIKQKAEIRKVALERRKKRKENREKKLRRGQLRQLRQLRDNEAEIKSDLYHKFEVALENKPIQVENTEHKYRSSGVYLVNPNSYRKCGNCANFTSSGKCSSQKVEVSENHSCRRFYTYKTYLGGAFSPR